MVNKWDKMVYESKKTLPVSFLTLGNTQERYKLREYISGVHVCAL